MENFEEVISLLDKREYFDLMGDEEKKEYLSQIDSIDEIPNWEKMSAQEKKEFFEQIVEKVEEGEEVSYLAMKPGMATNEAAIADMIREIETQGLRVCEMYYIWYSEEEAAKHYIAKTGKDYGPTLNTYMSREPVLAYIVAGEDAIAKGRTIVKKMRDLYAPNNFEENGFHGSDMPGAVRREVYISKLVSKRMETAKETDSKAVKVNMLNAFLKKNIDNIINQNSSANSVQNGIVK